MNRATVLLALMVGGCASTLGAPYREQTPPESAARWLSWRASQEGRNLDEQRSWDGALASGTRPAIDLEDVEYARRANGLYHHYCSSCHGQPSKAPPLSTAVRLGGRGYRFGMMMGGDKMAKGVFEVISKGRKQMPGFAGQMTNEQIWLLVEYLRSF